MPNNRIMRCNRCGGEDVVRGARASWDVDRQEWVILDVFDNEYCLDCEEETSIEEIVG